MSSDRASNLSALLSRNSIKSRSTTSFNTSLQADQQRSTAETQHENKELKLNTVKRLKFKTKNEWRNNNDFNSINRLICEVSSDSR